MYDSAFTVAFCSFGFAFTFNFSGRSNDAKFSFLIFLAHIPIIEPFTFSILTFLPVFLIWGIKVIKLSLDQFLTFHKLPLELLNIIIEILSWLSKLRISNDFNLKFIMILFHKSIIFFFKLVDFFFILFNFCVINFLNYMELSLEIIFHFLYFNMDLFSILI